MEKVFKTEIVDDRTCILTFDTPNTSANVLNEAVLNELNQELNIIENNATLEALVIISKKAKVFVAGADLHSFTKKSSDEDVRKVIELGQETFNRIERLKIKTVAAIHGACLGGGFELALACDIRIASNDKATKIGLPEILLGILPAWGGSTRLPHLIGLPKALTAILSGKQYAAGQAKKLGIVDNVVFPASLRNEAIKAAYKKGKARKQFHFVNLPPISTIIKNKATKSTLSKTRGNYPAPIRAIEVVTASVSSSLSDSLDNEAKAIVDLMKTEACKNLMNIFFLQDRSKKLKIDCGDGKPASVDNICVLGAGVMGAGIGQWMSARGKHILLKDINRDALAKGLGVARDLFKKAAKRRIMTQAEANAGMDRIMARSQAVPMKHIDLVIEAVVEEMGVKKKVFAGMEEDCSENTILASNTSALSITEMAADLKRPENVIGIHFFNPVHRMKLIEIIRGEKTSDETAARTLQLVKDIGKLPVIVNDRPGFLVNRILMPYLIESVKLFEAGVDIEKADKLMLNFGMPMGPLRLIDEVGLDVSQHVADDLSERLDNAFAESDMLQDMIDKGWMGRKSGKGFYDYGSGKKPVVNIAVNELLRVDGSTKPNNEEIVERMILLMVNEASRCLEEKVVDDPRDVDFGMIMGTGWAPFRGGPLRYADSIGVKTAFEKLNRYHEQLGDYFKPSALLSEMAGSNKSFYES